MVYNGNGLVVGVWDNAVVADEINKTLLDVPLVGNYPNSTARIFNEICLPSLQVFSVWLREYFMGTKGVVRGASVSVTAMGS